MALDTIDGASTGAQDRALTTGAVASQPAVVTQVSKTSIAVGGTLTDAATLTGSAGTVTGTVDFQLCSGTTTGCPQGTGTTFQSAVPLVSGSATSAPFGSNLGPGNYCIGLVYHNDGNSFYSDTYSGSATGECFTVTRATPAITTSLSANPIPVDTSASDTATLTGASANAGGTVDYRYYGSLSGCQADATAFPVTAPTGGTDVGTVTVTSGSVPNSNAVTFHNAGTFYWAAFYSGDLNNAAAASGCSTELLVVNQATPSITTAQHLIPNDDATISGASSNAGGTITFKLFSPSDATCANTPAFTQTVNVSGNGTYKTTNTAFVASDVGTWRWQVIYSGDSNNVSTNSACGVENFSITNG